MIAILFPVASDQSYRDSIDCHLLLLQRKNTSYSYLQSSNKRDFRIELQIKKKLEQLYKLR